MLSNKNITQTRILAVSLDREGYYSVTENVEIEEGEISGI